MAEKVELPSDAVVTLWPERPKGGQQVGGAYTGIKIECRGLTVICEIGRSQFINKEIATDMLLSGLTHPRFR